MSEFRLVGNKARYSFLDKRCIGRTCWAAGMYQHRSPLSGGGSRNTGSPDSPCCLNRAYRGCPPGPEGETVDVCPQCSGRDEPCNWCGESRKLTRQGVPAYEKGLAATRKAHGWRAA